MPLTMRPTGLGHGVYKDDVDYSISAASGASAASIETRTGPEHLRWFWALHFPAGPRTCAPTIARGHWKRRRRNSRSASASEGVGQAGRGALEFGRPEKKPRYGGAGVLANHCKWIASPAVVRSRQQKGVRRKRIGDASPQATP